MRWWLWFLVAGGLYAVWSALSFIFEKKQKG